MAQSPQEPFLFPQGQPKRGSYASSPTALAFELYGDATISHGQAGIGIRLKLGPYQLLFDCGAATVEALAVRNGLAEKSSPAPFSSPALLGAPAPQQAPSQSSLRDRGLPPVDFVFCSHAHTDHAQGLLALHRAWPQLPIFASLATCHLLPLNWPQGERTAFCQGLAWGEAKELAADLTVELLPAGHLPGAAAIVVTYWPELPYPEFPHQENSDPPDSPPIRVVYLGDCFLSATRCAPGLALTDLRGLQPDLLIAEGTYGVKRYPRRRQQENEWVEQLLAALDQKRFVLMPVVTLGLAQELIVLLRSHHRCTGQALDIWVDELVAQGCDRYLDLLEEMPPATQNFARNQSLFWDDRVRPYVHRLTSFGLARSASPGLVLVHPTSDWGQLVSNRGQPWELWLDRTEGLSSGASGWATHRAFMHQSSRSLQTLATLLQTGNLHLNSYQLTDHCDGKGTTQLIHNLKPKHLLLVHGGYEGALEALSELEELRRRYAVHLAHPGQEVPLPLGITPIDQCPVEKHYEGELEEDSPGIRLRLAAEITQDPRWQTLTETGLFDVTWQGNDLVIRGISPQALLGRSDAAPGVASNRDRQARDRRPTDCCKTCVFYQHQYCQNPNSPLEGGPVWAEGYCQEFQRQHHHR